MQLKSRGTIPACAGEPLPQSLLFLQQKDYPRVCGGTRPVRVSSIARWGLSPRVRGNPRQVLDCRPHPRTIPACAGEPCTPRVRPVHRRDYPRVCGGTSPERGVEMSGYGLSPRVRGNLHRRQRPLPRLGTIPACAGEPPVLYPADSQSADYPRVCGGTGGISCVTAFSRGLSPRVRGNRGAPLVQVSPSRTIPACAGEPLRTGSAASSPKDYPRVCGGTSS